MNGGIFPGELSLAIEEAVAAGAENIEIMVIGHYTGSALVTYLNPLNDPTGRYLDLSGAYDILRNRDLDVVVPVGAYMDREVTALGGKSFGKQLANFCYQATSENNSCVGIISTQPVFDWAVTRFSGVATDATVSGEIVGLFGSSLTGGSFNFTGYWDNLRFATPSARLTNEYVAYHTRPGRPAYFNSSAHSSTYYGPYYLSWLSGASDQDAHILDEISESSAVSVNTAYFTRWQAADSDGNPVVDSRNIKVDAAGYISVVTAPLVALSTQAKTFALALGAPPSSLSYVTDGAAPFAGNCF
jgi:hypothetical protein